MKKNLALFLLKAGSFIALLYCATKVTFSYMLGSSVAYFSAINCLAPLAGLCGVTSFVWLYYMLQALLLHGSLSSILLALHLPTLAAALYWKYDHLLYRVGLPLLCMIAFLLHPAGSQSAFYAVWWLIPMAMYIRKSSSFFVHALASTFTAHAVGTVMWLYVHPLTPALYAQLMPIVFVERMVYASGMTLAYYISTYFISRISSVALQTKKA
jgi:hypothetical protein